LPAGAPGKRPKAGPFRSAAVLNEWIVKTSPRRWYTFCLLGALLAVLSLSSAQAATSATLKPETLHYTVDMPLFKDAGRVTLSLQQLDKEKFEAVVEGETTGVIAFFTAHRRDRYATTMRLVQGKLQPLLYTEESWMGGKHLYKEYRFDYERRRLEMWRRGNDGEALVRKWETELTEPIYDPISAFYNFRIGGLGEIKAGDTLTVPGIPYPHPETIIVQIGRQEPGNRQAAVTIRNRPFDNEVGLVHVRFDDDLVPLSAWTRVMKFGKLSGRIISRH
jgi:hypothetical protein